MIRILATALLVLCLTAWGAFATSEDDLIYIDGLAYKKFTDVVFTGEVDEGEHRGAIKNGIFEGPWVGYWPNGRVEFKGTFKNGQREGPWVRCSIIGQLWLKGAFKNGKPEGPWLWYNEDGTTDEDLSGTYRNDVKVSD
jgi:antitoxin component YwqK of YwqJK toxin-antitoxin module